LFGALLAVMAFVVFNFSSVYLRGIHPRDPLGYAHRSMFFPFPVRHFPDPVILRDSVRHFQVVHYQSHPVDINSYCINSLLLCTLQNLCESGHLRRMTTGNGY